MRLIQGSPSAKAPEIGQPRVIDRDDRGRKIEPAVPEMTLGVHRLKEKTLDRLAIEDGGPGQCYFNPGIGSNHFDELFNEPLVDGKFERQGPNESFDLYGYAEAARLMLKPDRKDNLWEPEDRRPIWARPVSLEPEGGDQSSGRGKGPTASRSVFEQFDELNKTEDEP